jgi:hypothetical protein
MSMTPYQLQRAYDALNGKVHACPACNLPLTFIVSDKFFMMGIHDSPTTTTVPTRVMPCFILTCSNCGHIQLHNVHALGLAEVMGIPNPGEAL